MVVRIPTGPLGSLKCDPPKGNGRRPEKMGVVVETLLAGCLFSAFALAADRFVTIGRCTAQFCFGLLMRRLLLSPFTPLDS